MNRRDRWLLHPVEYQHRAGAERHELTHDDTRFGDTAGYLQRRDQSCAICNSDRLRFCAAKRTPR